MAGRAELMLYQGDSYIGGVLVRNADGTPADISGYTALAQIRRATADVDSVVAAEFTAVVASPNINLSLTSAQTKPLSGQYVWDLELTSPTAVVTTILTGRVRVAAEVSRAA